MKKTIVLEFDLDTGEVKGEADGYEGSACSLDLGPILDAAGQKVVRRPKKERRVVRQEVKR